MRVPLSHPGLVEPKNTNVVSRLQLIFVTSSSLHILQESPVELKPDAAERMGGQPWGRRVHTCPSSTVTEARSQLRDIHTLPCSRHSQDLNLRFNKRA